MERNHTKAINVDLLLEQITTEDNRLAFHRLFELYYPALCMYAKRFITDKETREDIVQDVFLKYMKHTAAFTDEAHEKAWLYRVTIKCVQQLSPALVAKDAQRHAIVAATAPRAGKTACWRRSAHCRRDSETRSISFIMKR